MVEGGGGPAFPVVFFDGEREMNIGEVRVDPTLEYKPFQLMLSQKIGISPNQISIYLVDRRKNPKSPFSEDRRRIPITGKVNFALICRQKECCFLVVLKRSRKSRNRREKAMTGLDLADLLPGSEFPRPAMHLAPENLILLRRNQQVPFHDRLQSERVNYEMAMARGNLDAAYFRSSGQNSPPGTGMDLGPNYDDWYAFHHPSAMMMTKTETGKVYCEECVNAEKNGKTPSFHPCANDAVITWLPAPLGPICRPNNPAP
ncbi:hypothetical protein SASPL_102103 [Salvia splendens]|uniref:DUF7138 domain-containing protein n=1 Tax=Salvia splendens TaxID=180675 RepID=A0A8X9ABU6_SALSN|nr:hypothetical protein SASPL_102103 [Salvia splendens]